MASTWTNTQIAKSLGSGPIHSHSEYHFGVGIDSRSCQTGNVFVCVRGENTDGHLYISQAIEAGATALVVEEACLTSGSLELPDPGSITIFSVPDGLHALQDLSRSYRNRLSQLCVVGVSGSNGKTSCKEMLSGLLENLEDSPSFFATKGNLNNHIGVPLSLLSIPAESTYAIIEMGMNHTGEIEFLSDLARPDIALITSVAGAHMEFFESIEEIAHAKFEIISGIKKGGDLFWPKGTSIEGFVRIVCKSKGIQLHVFDLVHELVAEKIVSVDRTGLALQYNDSIIKNPFYFGTVMGANLFTCLGVMEKMGLPRDELIKSSSFVKPLSSGRFSVTSKKRKNSINTQLLVDDTYNANPDSFEEALRALRVLVPEGRLAVLAGQMGELGRAHAEGHKRVGIMASQLKYDFMSVCGDKSTEIMIQSFQKGSNGTARMYENVTESIQDMGCIDWSVFDGILIKGSRSSKMEKAVERLKEIKYV